MFHDIYGHELDVLHKLAAELAERCPELASILGRDADPAMARLLQRVAFAFARVRQRIDDDVPEIIHAIFEDIDRALLEPVPSTTLVELAAHPKTLRAATVIEAGATFTDSAAHPCVFSMTEPCEVRPWALRAARVVGGERREIRLSLEVLGGAELPRAVGSDTIILALTGALPSALDLRAWLLEHATAVRAVSGTTEIVLARNVVAVPRVRDSSKQRHSLALAPLRDYFACARVFCRVALPGAQQLASLGAEVRRLDLVIELDASLPPAIVIDTTTIALHTAPAVSLASVEARVEPAGPLRFVLRTDEPDHRIVDVMDVDLVDPGSLRALTRWTPDAVLRDLDEGGGPILFEVRRSPSVLEGEIDFELSLLDDDGPVPLPLNTHLRARVLATSAARAAGLAVGDISHATERSPVAMTFRNVTPVTRGGPPLFGGDRLWELFHRIKLGLPALTERESLGRLLSLLNGPARFGWPQAKPDANAFAPLRGLTRRRGSTIAGDEVCPGLELSLELDTASFSSHGDVQLFGELVSALLASALKPHEWVRLTLQLANGERIIYPRLFGTRGGARP